MTREIWMMASPRMTMVAALVLPLGAFAAPPEREQATLDDVVVSVSRAEQQSFDTPAAISAVDGEAIRAAGPRVNLSESLNRVPGLTILNRQNYAQDLQLSIRGFGSHATFGIRGIRLYVDGIPATTPDGQSQGSTVSLTSTDRIEVLRGPLALMYGNTTGGVIQAYTRDPSPVPTAELSYDSGSFGMRRSDVQVSGTVGRLGLLADYSSFDTNGYRDNSAAERHQFNGRLVWSQDAKTRVNVVLNQFDMPYALDPAGLTAAQLAQNPQQAGTNTVARGTRKIVSQNQVGSTLVHELDADSSISSRIYIGTRQNTQYQVGVPGVTPTGAWVGLNREYYGLGLQYNARTQWGAAPVQWVAGYDFDRSSELRQSGAAALGQMTSTTNAADNRAENSDFFTQATALVSERFSLTGGLRYSMVTLANTNYYTPSGSGSVGYYVASPVLGVTWHATDNLNVYANYGRGFETPTLDAMAYTPAGGGFTTTFNTQLNAARSDQYEVGTKWVPAPGTRVDATLFQIYTTNEIVVATSSGGVSTYANAPSTQRTGAELSLASVLGSHWRATLSATAMDATYTQGFTTAGQVAQAGNRMPGIPQFYVMGEWLWASSVLESARRLPLAGTVIGAEVINAGRLYANDSNTAYADGYTVFNLKASQGWQIGRTRLTVYGRVDNLTNQQYVGSVIVNQASGQYYEPAPGYNWTVGVRMGFAL